MQHLSDYENEDLHAWIQTKHYPFYISTTDLVISLNLKQSEA